jgi:hypothetical protein
MPCGEKHDSDDRLDRLIHIFSSIRSTDQLGGVRMWIPAKDVRLVRELLLELKVLRGEQPLYRSIVNAILDAKFSCISGANALLVSLHRCILECRSELRKVKIDFVGIITVDSEEHFRIKLLKNPVFVKCDLLCRREHRQNSKCSPRE